MPKGFSTLLIIIFVSITVVGAGFFYYNYNSQQQVKGVSKTKIAQDRAGVSLKVNSVNQTWTMFMHLCKTLDDCTSSLSSGTKIQTIHGGMNLPQDIYISSDPSWASEYKYLKLYTQANWEPGMSTQYLNVENLGDVPQSFIQDFNGVQSIIIPLEQIAASSYISGVFSDAR